MELFQEKKKIRKTVLAAREALSAPERERGDCLITERILGHQWFYRSDELLCFVSYGSEISTLEILREALGAGKKVYVPKVLGEKNVPEMVFYRITCLEELKPGYRGIPEPPGDSEVYAYREAAAEHTLMLMPGAAFDQYRNRLGYGKGFYDRYLADKPGLQLRTIALCYKCQLTESLLVSDTDIKPCQVICV